MKRISLWLAMAAVPMTTLAEETAKPSAEDSVHNELRAVRDGMIDAFNKGDFDRLTQYMRPDAVITWQNAEVTRSREEARKYYERMLVGPDAIVEKLTVDLKVDELAVIHGGDTAIATGTLGDHYKLRDGREFTMNSRWSATVVKEGDRWQLACAHCSVNAFDNEILRSVMYKVIIYVGVGG
ncbi:MAG: nuclear transport factor 2 family protein, partial [Pirellulales bacterium]